MKGLPTKRAPRPTSKYVAEVCHARDVAVGRLNAILVSLDCKSNCMESNAKGNYRDEQNKPLPGADGDLARSCDEQLLDVFLAVKRLLRSATC